MGTTNKDADNVGEFRTDHRLSEYLTMQGFNSHAFSDIVVQFRGSTYNLHRLILAQSTYFRSMLKGPWIEATSSVANLQIDDENVNVEVVGIALAYLYGQRPKLTDANAFGVLAAASFFDIQDLCAICADFLKSRLCIANFLSYQALADGNDYGVHGKRFADACWGFLFQSASKELKEVLAKLSSQNLQSLFSSDNLWIFSEEERFELAHQTLLAKEMACKSSIQLLEENQDVGDEKMNETSMVESSTLKPIHGHSSCSQKDETKDDVETDGIGNDGTVGGGTAKGTHTTNTKMMTCHINEENYSSFLSIFEGGTLYYCNMTLNGLFKARNKLENMGFPCKDVFEGPWIQGLLCHRIQEKGSGTCTFCSLKECSCEHPHDDFADLGAPTTWNLKMRLNDFPPFRFGVAFQDVDKLADLEIKASAEVFYAGSLWKISVQAFIKKDPPRLPTLGTFLHWRKAEASYLENKGYFYIDKRDPVKIQCKFIVPSKHKVETYTLTHEYSQTCTSGWGSRETLLFDELPNFLQDGALRIAVSIQLL